MEVHYNKEVEINNAVVTIGSFDGVHYGHLAIIEALNKKAKSIGGESVVITFSPHPRIVLGHDTATLFFLNSLKEKLFLLEQAGINHLIVMTFDENIAKQTMEEFFINYIKEKLRARAMVVGYNHRFGSDRNSDYDALLELGKQNAIEIIRIEKKGIDERDISSTTIRNLLKSGNLNQVNKYLSHPYLFISDIDSIGTVLYHERKKLYPQQGDYNVEIEYEGKNISTVAHISRDNTIILDNIEYEMRDARIYFISKI